MKPHNPLSSLFRAPLRTLIAFALLVATSFAFVSRGVEYFTTERAIETATQEYTAVGTLVTTEENYEEKYKEHFGISPGRLNADSESMIYYNPIDEEAIDLLLSSDYVRAGEVRRVAGGISDERKSVIEQPVGTGDANANRLALDEAIVIAECLDVVDNPYIEFLVGEDWEAYVLFTVDEVLAGNDEQYAEAAAPRWLTIPSGTADIKSYTSDKPIFRMALEFDDPLYDSFVAGHRYVLSLSPAGESGDIAKVLTEGAPFPLLDLTLIEEENGSVSYEDYAYIFENRYGRITEVNHRKQELVYTSDMSMLPRFHDGTLYITDGRMITPGDTGDVCVINAEYANENGIRVGDTISFTVDPNTMVYAGEVFARELRSPETYAIGARYSRHEFEQVQKDFEVVGIWASQPNGNETLSVSDADNYDTDALRYALNTVFVPSAAYPWADEVEPHRFPSTFSFMLEHPGDMRNLELELGDKLRELGYELVINDRGYASAEAAFVTMRSGAVIGFVAMGEALLFVLIFITYLFYIRKKSECAAMRVLGASTKRVSRSLLIELLVLGAVAVAVGCGAAVLTVRGYATGLAASIAETTAKTASVTYSPWLVPVFGGGVLVLLLIFAAAGMIALNTVGRKFPPEPTPDGQ